MATITEPIDTVSRSGDESEVAGAIAGFFAGAMFGAMMSTTTMMENVAAMVGMESVAVGWVVHFAVSILVALVYVKVVSIDRLVQYATRPSTGVGLGLGYGIVLWIVGVAFVMPLWLGFVTPATPSVPNVDWMSFVGHLIYGVFLGTLYPLLLSHDRPHREVSVDRSDVGAHDESRAAELGEERESPQGTAVFSAESVRERLDNDEVPHALILVSAAIERTLIEAIAEEADVAPDHVGEFGVGEGLDGHVQTASLLGLFDEHGVLLREVAEHRNAMVRQPPGEYADGLDGDSEERRVIADAIAFLEERGA